MELIINNSLSQVDGLTREQFSLFKEALSYTLNPQAAYFSGGHNRKRYLIDKKGVFPTGLLPTVKSVILKNQLKCQVTDQRIQPKGRQGLFKLSLRVTPYPEQINAAKAILARYRGIVTAPTGMGKSVIVALAIDALQVPTLVVVPTLELKRQLTESLSECFGSQVVGTLSQKRAIAVENVAALDHKEKLIGYDCVIIDEFHHAGASSYRKLNQKAWTDVYYRIGLTATPFRSKDEERLLLESVLSEVIYQVPYQNAVDAAYIVPMVAYYYDLPKQKVEGYTWAQVYSELVVNNKVRNELVAQVMKNLYRSGLSTLCLVKEIEHGKALSKLTGAAFANGVDGDSAFLIKGFNDKKLTALIGTSGILGEGVDTKPAEYVIIAGLGKSKNQFMQQVGRGFRVFPGKEECVVILFRDPSHKWTLAHFRAQVKYLAEEYGVVPTRLNFSGQY